MLTRAELTTFQNINVKDVKKSFTLDGLVTVITELEYVEEELRRQDAVMFVSNSLCTRLIGSNIPTSTVDARRT